MARHEREMDLNPKHHVLEANVLATATLILPIPKRHRALTSKETVIFGNALKETVIFYNGFNFNRILTSALTIIQHSRIILGGLPFFEALPTSCMFHLGLSLETSFFLEESNFCRSPSIL